MAATIPRVVYWAPRVLGIAMAVFMSLFALDAFGDGQTLWQSVGAFLIHLVPTYVLVAALALAWRREWLGAAVYIGLGLFYALWVRNRVDLIAVIAISTPLLVTGVLFLANWVIRQHARSIANVT